MKLRVYLEFPTHVTIPDEELEGLDSRERDELIAIWIAEEIEQRLDWHWEVEEEES